MNKILGFFPINKIIRKKNIKSLIISIADYMMILLVLLIARNLLISVKGVGNVFYNVFSLFRLYAIVGIVLGVIQCFSGKKYRDVNYIQLADISRMYKSNRKILALGITGVCLILMMIITPSGLKAKRIHKNAKNNYSTSKESNKSEDVIKDDIAADVEIENSDTEIVVEDASYDDVIEDEINEVEENVEIASEGAPTDSLESFLSFDFTMSSGKIIAFNSDGHFVLTGYQDTTSMTQMDTENSLYFADMCGDYVSEPVLTFYEPEFYERINSPYLEGEEWCWARSTIFFKESEYTVALNMMNSNFSSPGDNQAAMDDMFSIDKNTLDTEAITAYAEHIKQELLPMFRVTGESKDNLTQKINAMLPDFGNHPVKRDAKIYIMNREVKRSDDGIFNIGDIKIVSYQNEYGTEGGYYFFGTKNAMQTNDVCGIKKDLSAIDGMYILDGYRGLSPKACVFIVPKYDDIDLSEYEQYSSYDDIPVDKTAGWYELMDKYNAKMLDTQYFVSKEDDIQIAKELFDSVFE